MVGVCAEFRAAKRGKPYSAGWAAEDAKSAIRWMRANHGKLGVDPDRIAAAGESSGATMAAQTAVSPGFESSPMWISSKPNALVLFDPAMDAKMLLGFFRKRMKMDDLTSRRLVPNLNLCGDLVPSILVYGLKDFLRPGLDEFSRIIRRQELPVRVIRVKGQPHGFMKLSPWQERSLRWVDEFFVRLGWLKGRSSVPLPRLPFDWGKPVFAGSLPTIRETEWFNRVRPRLAGMGKEIYQLSFAPLKGRRVAALVALRPRAKFGPNQAAAARGIIGDALKAELGRFDPARRLVVQITDFPYRPRVRK
jgi:dienelactone hydrolase